MEKKYAKGETDQQDAAADEVYVWLLMSSFIYG